MFDGGMGIFDGAEGSSVLFVVDDCFIFAHPERGQGDAQCRGHTLQLFVGQVGTRIHEAD